MQHHIKISVASFGEKKTQNKTESELGSKKKTWMKLYA